MRERKSFLLRIDPTLHEALERWAKDDLRSLNGQIEFLLKESVRKRGDKSVSNTPTPGVGDD